MDRSENNTQKRILLFSSVFIISTCGLIYELISGTVASYLLGDSVFQFSTVIGVYLFSMGIGSYLSKYISNEHIIHKFVVIELLIALLGGFSAGSMFVLFPIIKYFSIWMYGQLSLIGILVGLEIPLLMRLLEKLNISFKNLVSEVLTFDYIGALIASVLFPLLLIPYLGLVSTSLLFGVFNALVAIVFLRMYAEKSIKGYWHLKLLSEGTFILLVVALLFSDWILAFSEKNNYQHDIIFSKQSPYQKIVVTKQKNDLRLYLNGNLQFSTTDEYRYHESLVFPGLQAAINPKKVLILGGGDGLALREVLRNTAIQKIDLVDLDPLVTDLFTKNDLLQTINKRAFLSSKVRVFNEDAFKWLQQTKEQYDVVLVDFPDPSNFSIGKLYSMAFYKLLWQTVTPNGACVIQSTSPYFAPKSFWCIHETIRAAGFQTLPFHCHIPSFGEWGYVLASKNRIHIRNLNDQNHKYLNQKVFDAMTVFPKDLSAQNIEINQLDNQKLVYYFIEEWGKVY